MTSTKINQASRGVSGKYWISTTTNVYQVYCDMELECGGGHKGGWMRIVDLDTSKGDDCPSGWTKITTPIAVCLAPSSAAVLDVTLQISLLLVFHIESYVEWQWVIKRVYTTDGFVGYSFTKRSINGPYICRWCFYNLRYS